MTGKTLDPLWEGVKNPQELYLIEQAVRLAAHAAPNHDAIRVLNIRLLLSRFDHLRSYTTRQRAIASMRNLLLQISDQALRHQVDEWLVTQALQRQNRA